MKKIIILILVAFNFTFAQESKIIKDKNDKDILVGKVAISDFQLPQFENWYNFEYDNYHPNQNILEMIKLEIDYYKIKIVLGTWCPDSRREFPRFMKILSELGYAIDSVEIITVNRKEKSFFVGAEKLSIKYVPTFMFFIQDTEVGRIEETPLSDNLETDILDILVK